jgi:nucleoside-diphosphate-sugar epimerase
MGDGRGHASPPHGRRPLNSLFITGASGFIGRHLLDRIAGRYDRITALSRTARPPDGRITWLQGDIREPGTWTSRLDASTDVAHLAAATGAASATLHRAVNAQGTEQLVQACARARVAGILFVSSIAAGFPDDPRYPYATAKREAEAVLRAGKVPFVIVRPTIVLGPGSPILAKLAALAGGPLVAAIGNGRAKVQPIHVDDVAEALAMLLQRRAYDRRTIELGGPETLTMSELLVRLRTALGRPPARKFSVPYAPMRGALIALEAVLGDRTPVTAGQLTPFVQDSVARPDPLFEELKPRMKPLERMLEGGAVRV